MSGLVLKNVNKIYPGGQQSVKDFSLEIRDRELFGGFKVGQEVHCRVTKVRGDGKLDLSAREKAYNQIFEDAELVLKVIGEFDGVLPFNDKADPEVIAREFKLSKNAFKRAVGHLLKEGKIEITEKSIRVLEETK